MKNLQQFVIEATKKESYKKAETYKEFGKKWFDKCKDFAIAGSTRYAKYHMHDFSGFLKDMEEWFEPSQTGKIYDNICKARWEMCKALKDKDIDKFIKISKDNNISHFLYGTYNSENVYGSYFLDVYMLLSTYNYICGNRAFLLERVLNSIWNINETMKQDWQEVYIDTIDRLKKYVSSDK